MSGVRVMLCWVLWLLGRAVLSLRYRVRVEGLEEVRGLHKALVLPNHPAYVDPMLVFLTVWPALRPRPLLLAEMFRHPLLAWLPWLLEAVEVPSLERYSAQARAQAEAALAEVTGGLGRGRNHIVWPAGRVQRRGVEDLGSARAAADILAQNPDAAVVLVRTRGLWGSRFSVARTGDRPKLVGGLLRGAGLLLANLLFFAPRRPVTITLQRVAPTDLPARTREALNPFLEQWYNAPGPEQPTFVPYHFAFGPRTYEFPPPAASPEVNLAQIRPQTKAAVAELLAERLGRPLTEEESAAQTPLESLGADSLERMELALAVEERFGFRGEQVPVTVGDLWALAQGLYETVAPKPAPAPWFAAPTGNGNLEPLADRIGLALVRRALASPGDIAAADDLSGALTYQRLLLGAMLLSRRLRDLPGEAVGLMLPSSVAADVAFLALHLAGKLPVMMNWTTGPANLAHAAAVMKLTHVVTSRRFIDRTGIAIEGVRNLHLEDLRAGIGRFEKLAALLRVRLLPGSVLAAVPRPDPDQPAVVLFTSGSEKAPKAVPLTHANLLANVHSAVTGFGLTREDSLLAFLPPFHSFGLTVTMLLPMLSGLRVVHHPDPTDAGGLARKVAAWRPSITCGTPTFAGYILDRLKPEDAAAIRLLVVGAEKCPPRIFERFAALNPRGLVIEGYGVSECGPLVAANSPQRHRPGSIGVPVPGIQVRIVDPDSYAPLPEGRMGMLLAAGPHVFPGYLGHEGPQPFHQAEGQRWYITGDLAEIDADGFIHFRGRLKRFLKAGGEMISLPAIEEPLAQRYPPTQDGPRVAVEGVETEGGRRIVLFSTDPLTTKEANAVLQAAGLRGILRIDEVRQVERIPLLGTGKTDYKVLRAMIA